MYCVSSSFFFPVSRANKMNPNANILIFPLDIEYVCECRPASCVSYLDRNLWEQRPCHTCPRPPPSHPLFILQPLVVFPPSSPRNWKWSGRAKEMRQLMCSWLWRRVSIGWATTRQLLPVLVVLMHSRQPCRLPAFGSRLFSVSWSNCTQKWEKFARFLDSDPDESEAQSARCGCLSVMNYRFGCRFLPSSRTVWIEVLLY